LNKEKAAQFGPPRELAGKKGVGPFRAKRSQGGGKRHKEESKMCGKGRQQSSAWGRAG